MKNKFIVFLISAFITFGSFAPIYVHAQGLPITYTVVSGDTLWGISRQHSISVNDLKLWNNLTSDTILIGQVLRVSPIHIVVAGDTLWGISRTYGTTVDSLMKLNNLTTSVINIGQAIKYAETSAAVPAPAPPAPTAPVIQTVNHVVQFGDTLWGIARRYNTSVDAIMKSNMLVVDVVMPNQTLTVPVNSTEIVKPVGITMMRARANSSFGDIYTWENAMRLWTVGTTGTLRDLATGRTFRIKYYGGSNHSDIVTLTQQDTDIMQGIFGAWSWNKRRPMILTFTKGGVNYQMAVSLTGMPHSGTDIPDNGMPGHCDMYFFNSVGHSSTVIDSVHQNNVLIANGQ